jgi:ligand-binding SRPBCC domain-containing protein
MVRIELATVIAAPIERCFDLSRSIDLHMASTNWTGEKAVSGVTSGLIGPNQEVTWQGRHFGLMLTHASRITAFNRPYHFQDCMLRGRFQSFCHDHFFEEQGSGTLMRDQMAFDAPFGVLGRMLETLLLESHMRDLLVRRNEAVKQAAESGGWRKYLGKVD